VISSYSFWQLSSSYFLIWGPNCNSWEDNSLSEICWSTIPLKGLDFSSIYCFSFCYQKTHFSLKPDDFNSSWKVIAPTFVKAAFSFLCCLALAGQKLFTQETSGFYWNSQKRITSIGGRRWKASAKSYWWVSLKSIPIGIYFACFETQN